MHFSKNQAFFTKSNIENYTCLDPILNQAVLILQKILGLRILVTPYTQNSCHLCDFGSSHKSRLEVHIKTVHEEPQDYPCEHCPQICHKKKELQAHIKTIHGKLKQHKCEYCESAFYRRRDKEKHLVKAHKINVLTTLSTEDLAKTLQHDVTAGIHSMHHHHEPV